jgi:hypothetical protein
MKRVKLSLATALLLAFASLTALAQSITFTMVPSTGAVNAKCIQNATARVTINTLGPVQVMHIRASGLPANTEFDTFITQLPNTPFGLAWYQGDLKTDARGNGVAEFIGRFSKETFIVATGTGSAPVVDSSDASSNPATDPIHTFHVGLWFGSPAAAQAAGCPNTPTPFSGDHNAGIQALSTKNFPDLSGPLSNLE